MTLQNYMAGHNKQSKTTSDKLGEIEEGKEGHIQCVGRRTDSG